MSHAAAGFEPMNASGQGERKLRLMDATPLRIKSRAAGLVTPEVATHYPSTFDELVETVRDLASAGQSYVVVGGRSNVVGALDVQVDAAVSTELLTGVIDYDPVSNLVRVGAGTLGGWLENWLAERDRTIGQFPQSLYISTVGGWVNTRACGSLSARNGGVERAVVGARIVAPTGEILEFGPRVRPAGGLDGLAAFLGTEGSLGVVADVTFQVQRRLPERVACFLLPDLDALIEAQRALVQGGYPVALLRGNNAAESAHILDDRTVGGCLLVVTTMGPAELVDQQYDAIVARLAALDGHQLPDGAADKWYAERYAVDTMMEDRNRDAGSAFDTIEVSVPWAAAGACAHELESTMAPVVDRYFLHFSHAYESGVCFYSLLWLSDDAGDRAVLAKLRAAWDQVLDVVERHGGTIGHHHGVGAVRAARYGRSADARVHRALKEVWDPAQLLRAPLLDRVSAQPDLGV